MIRPADAALRAQPQAREDAQPVGWQRRIRNTAAPSSSPKSQWSKWVDCDDRQRKDAQETGGVPGFPELIAEVRPIYTHPAPDALREAMEALEAARKVIELFRDEDVLSEGVHTGLRKGTDAKDAHDLWAAIRNSKTSAWSDAIAFALDPYFSMWGGDAAVAKIDQALDALQQEGRDRG